MLAKNENRSLRQKEGERAALDKRYFLNILISAGIGFAIALLMLLVAAFVLDKTQKPELYYSAVITLIYIISSFAAGYSVQKKNKSRALLCAFLSAASLILIYWLSALFFIGSDEAADSSRNMILNTVIILCSAIVGSVFATGKKSKPARKKR